jgi:hypothetical protein
MHGLSKSASLVASLGMDVGNDDLLDGNIQAVEFILLLFIWNGSESGGELEMELREVCASQPDLDMARGQRRRLPLDLGIEDGAEHHVS